MQPGDNFAVAASLTDTYRDSINLNSSDGSKLVDSTNKIIPVSGATNTDNVPAIRTEMLTVWRRLHIEVDSMADVTVNHVTGTFTSANTYNGGYPVLQVAISPTPKANQLENGRLVTNGVSYPIFENTANTISISIPRGTLTTIVGQSFIVYDDDDFNSNDGTKVRPLHGDEGEDIPLLNQDFLKDNDIVPVDINTPDSNVLARAYIRPKYDFAESRDNDAYFLANIPTLPSNQGQAIRDAFHFDNVLLNARKDFWTVYLLSGYQYISDEDGDPLTEKIVDEKLTVGVSDSQHGQGSIVFLETSLHECTGNPYDCSIAVTKVHEIGHLLNADHNQGGVMDNVSADFSDISLNEIRKNIRP